MLQVLSVMIGVGATCIAVMINSIVIGVMTATIYRAVVVGGVVAVIIACQIAVIRSHTIGVGTVPHV